MTFFKKYKCANCGKQMKWPYKEPIFKARNPPPEHSGCVFCSQDCCEEYTGGVAKRTGAGKFEQIFNWIFWGICSCGVLPAIRLLLCLIFREKEED